MAPFAAAGRGALVAGAVTAAAAGAAADTDGGLPVPDGSKPETLLKIANASWEFTDGFDCWHHDMATFPVKVWGQDGAVADREMCAKKCLEMEECVAFNFPSPRFPGDHLYDPQVCYLKRTAMNAGSIGMHCEKAFDTAIWHYYSLLSHNVWTRMVNGFKGANFPFFRPLQVQDQSSIRWIQGTRWAAVGARHCLGRELSSTALSLAGSADDRATALDACASQCLANGECTGFEFPNVNGDEAWDAAANGEAACTLKTFKVKTVEAMTDCAQETRSEAWTFHALVDAWEVRLNQDGDWVRLYGLPDWQGPALGSCAATAGEGQWLQAGSDAPLQAAAGPGCCTYTLNKCGSDAATDCKPYVVYPEGCVGLCKTPFSGCRCWSQKDVPASGGCCTECDADCSGEPKCLPAGCDGTGNMCDSESQIGRGSVCACTAQGLDHLRKFVPPDVAAGWEPTKQHWA